MQSFRFLFALAWLVLLGTTAQAQIYRSVDAQGRVIFSDQAPPVATPSRAIRAGSDAASSGTGLPYELGQIAARYPVTLYSGNDCSPCAAGRTYLVNRGIPFTEKTVTSFEDLEALKRLSAEAGLPLLGIGGQRLKGFSATEWGQFLDVAGYPTQSQLPPSYRQVEATPLISLQPATPATSRVSKQDPAAAVPAPTASPTNPAGIRF
jgi:glutaredoxin